MIKNNNCFDCLNHGKGKLAENTGWYHPCKLGIENNGMREINKCHKYFPCIGFQIGGYYSHMNFKYNSEKINECMELIIHSDGEFPTEVKQDQIQFHICDFRQIEEWVKFWGKYLREKGVVIDDKVQIKGLSGDIVEVKL